MSTTAGAPPRFTPRTWGTLFVLCGAIFLEGIDVAMLNVALPAIRADLGLSTGELQWVVSAYVLGYGGFMLAGGRAADLFGRRRMFLIWLAVFLVVSAVGGLAGEGWLLIAARFVAGVAAAVMTPAGLSIITTGFEEGPQRNRALLVYSGTAAGGFSLGLVLGGLLSAVNWRLVLFVPAALALVILLLGAALIPATPQERTRDRRVDVLGAVTVTAAIVLLVLGVERSAHSAAGWTTATIAAGLVLAAVFVLVERRSAAPLIRLGLLRSGALVRANLAGLLFAAAFFGFQFIAVLYLQELRGWSALETSLAMLAIGADAVLAPTLTPRLVERFGNAKVIVAGLVLAVVSYALFLPISTDTVYLAMFPTMIVLGVAFALAYGPLTIVATDGVAEHEQGLAGGLLYTAFQFGAALGLAACTAVLTGASGGVDGYRSALVVPIAAAAVAAVISASGLRKRVAR